MLLLPRSAASLRRQSADPDDGRPFSQWPGAAPGWRRSARRTGCGSSPTSCARVPGGRHPRRASAPCRCGDRTALVADQHHVRRTPITSPARRRLRRRPAGPDSGADSVAAMVKHFPGGGPQLDGNDPHFGGDASRSIRRQRRLPPAPFRAALDTGAAEVMPYGMPVGTDWDEVGFGFQQVGDHPDCCGTSWDSTGSSARTGVGGNHPDLGTWASPGLGSSTGPADQALQVIGPAPTSSAADCTRNCCWDAGARRPGQPESRIDESRCAGCCGHSPWGCSSTRSSTRIRSSRWARSDFRDAGLAAQRDSLTLLTNTGLLPLARAKIFPRSAQPRSGSHATKGRHDRPRRRRRRAADQSAVRTAPRDGRVVPTTARSVRRRGGAPD